MKNKISNHQKKQIQFGDAVVIVNADGEQKTFFSDGIDKNPKEYTINGHPITKVEFTHDASLFIVHANNEVFFRDKSNKKLDGSENWTDYYLEPYTFSFYRMDNRGRWYDIQGYLLRTNFLIKDQVLCSLAGKKSKKSIYYKNQTIYINPKSTLVEVGKVVYDVDLNILNYFGEKITGLGQSNITFDANNSLQEVHLGLTERAYINEQTYEPYTINGEEIITHLSSIQKGEYHFEIFRSKKNEYLVCNSIDNVLQYESKPLNVDFESYITIGDFDLIKVNQNEHYFYLDLGSRKPFNPVDLGELVIDINKEPVKKDKDLLYNIMYETQNIVFNSTLNKQFSIGTEAFHPEQISIVKGFEKHFYYAKIKGITKLCDQKNNMVVQLQDGTIEVSKILDDTGNKLVNILTTGNQKFALDFRQGSENFKLAKSGKVRIVEALEKPAVVGSKILQNVKIETLGGSKDRVVDLNDPDLELFQLPNDLKAYSEQLNPSIFAGNVITHIDLNNSVQINQKVFFNASFLSYLNEPKKVIIQQENARPLQLDGVGHRNELAQFFEPLTISKEYYLSAHRIIGVKSLTEDLKESQLLFSFKTMTSWLPFYDTYLPIFKKIIDFEGYQKWEYHLFEIHNVVKDKEYIAVEQNPPYRILVEKSKKKYSPRIVKSKELILKSPEEISSIRRFFSNTGYLVDIG